MIVPSKAKVLCAVLLAPLAVGAAISSPISAKPAKNTAAKIVWQSTFEQALAASKRTGKPIMVDFYATWCGPCKALDRDVWTKSPVIQESRNWINVKIDGEKRTDLMKRYKIEAFPTIAFLKPGGNVSKLMAGLGELAVSAPENSSQQQFTDHLVRGMAKMMRSQRQKATVRSV